GKPVSFRSGTSNKSNGKIFVSPGNKEGSLDFEVSLPYQVLEAMGNDSELLMSNGSDWYPNPQQSALMYSRL
ncbi:putative acetyltransferase, partial [Trifolium medium]|nr:putative acetyltransferase [Trifolium medium]